MDAIIQARLDSKRLPRKLLLELNGKPLIDHVVNRVKKSNLIKRVIIATTKEEEDHELVDYCEKMGLLYFRGETDNVLSRIINTCEYFQCDKIVRVCSDNPFIDTRAMDHQINAFLTNDKIDYCTYTTYSGTPIILKPIGLFVEAISLRALKKIKVLTKKRKTLNMLQCIFMNLKTILL